MKTIEERAKAHFGGFEDKVFRRDDFEEALRELAADLNAEKEKEVSELREKLATLAKDYSEVVSGESEMEELTRLREANRKIANESIANQLALQSVCYKQRAALEYYAGAPWVGHAGSWSNSNIAEPADVALENKFDSSLLDEVKRVLGAVSSDAGRWFMSGETCDLVDQLLTRLGGSHE